MSAAALSYGVADVLGGSGFLAVYLVGLAVGSTPSRHRGHLVAFHEALAFLAQVTMFVVLGLLVFPSDLPEVMVSGFVLALLLVVVVRPLAVLASTAFSDFTARERAFLGWAGLRGAVPIVLGTFVLSEHVDHGETIFNAVFFVVLVSALLQGTTLERVAARARAASSRRAARDAQPLSVDEASPLDLVEFDVSGDYAIAGAAVRELGLPRSALVAVIARGKHTIPPRGSTVVEAGDRLYVLVPHGDPGARSTTSSAAGAGASRIMPILCCPDKFRGSLTARGGRGRDVPRRRAGGLRRPARCRSPTAARERSTRSSARAPGTLHSGDA